MEGEPHIIKLGPYLAPAPAPLGFYTRRLTRHGFLSNRWGLRRYRHLRSSQILDEQPVEMLQGRAGLPAMSRELGARGVSAQEVQLRLDDNFDALKRGLQNIGDGVQRLETAAEKIPRQLIQAIERLFEEKAADNIPEQVIQAIDKLLDQRPAPGVTERMEKLHDAEKAGLRREHGNELELLRRERALDKQRLEKLEKDLRIANIHAQLATRDLSEARRKLNAYDSRNDKTRRPENHEKAIRALFRDLRDAVVDFAASSAIQLRQAPGTTAAADSWFHPRSWSRASARQRRLRVTASVFHILFRRILRPSLRMFGVQSFLRATEHHAISAAEAHLRALEKDLETQGVDQETLHTWIATTIDATAHIRDIPGNTEGVAQEILEALSPVVGFTFRRNAEKIKGQISAICERAVRLKLAMRRAAGKFKVEVPSKDTKKWGEPGCDEETMALPSGVWLEVVEQEATRDSGEAWEPGSAKPTKDGIAYIPFGALTRTEQGPDGKREKMVLEKGWVVCNNAGDRGKLKRKAPAPAGGDEKPQKRVQPNRGVSPAHLARVKALMGQE